MRNNLTGQNLDKQIENTGNQLSKSLERHYTIKSLNFWKNRKLLILVFFLFLALGALSLWQYKLHRSLSQDSISCGGEWTYGVQCPTGSYCGSPYGQDLGPLAGGNCRAFFWFPLDFVKAYSQNKETKVKPFEDSTFQIEIDTIIGGGFTGGVGAYSINSAGEVYRISSPAWHVSQKKELIKRISQETVKLLRNSLIQANIFSMEEGVPTYSGKSWKVVISGQEKTIYFVETPENLLETERILKEILEMEG